jgi:hypothetical protein
MEGTADCDKIVTLKVMTNRRGEGIFVTTLGTQRRIICPQYSQVNPTNPDFISLRRLKPQQSPSLRNNETEKHQPI